MLLNVPTALSDCLSLYRSRQFVANHQDRCFANMKWLENRQRWYRKQIKIPDIPEISISRKVFRLMESVETLLKEIQVCLNNLKFFFARDFIWRACQTWVCWRIYSKLMLRSLSQGIASILSTFHSPSGSLMGTSVIILRIRLQVAYYNGKPHT